MTNKDFIKLLLISVGCDKKYEIDSHRTDDGSIYYEVTGDGCDENQSIYFDGFSIYDLILSFLNNIKEDPDIDLLNKLNYSVNHLSQKSLLDDKIRNSVYEQQKKAAEEHERYIEETKYITDCCNKNNPWPNCKNKKHHWDDLHYNCAENHYMRCPILKEYYSKRDKLYREYTERKMKEKNGWKTYSRQNSIYRHIIVDNYSDMLKGQNFVQIYFQTGLTDEDINKMKAFLEMPLWTQVLSKLS